MAQTRPKCLHETNPTGGFASEHQRTCVYCGNPADRHVFIEYWCANVDAACVGRASKNARAQVTDHVMGISELIVESAAAEPAVAEKPTKRKKQKLVPRYFCKVLRCDRVSVDGAGTDVGDMLFAGNDTEDFAAEDSLMLGTPCIAVSRNDNGEPFFTIPEADVEMCYETKSN